VGVCGGPMCVKKEMKLLGGTPKMEKISSLKGDGESIIYSILHIKIIYSLISMQNANIKIETDEKSIVYFTINGTCINTLDTSKWKVCRDG